jgi:manganese-dependent inorganic pyrophosphatase
MPPVYVFGHKNPDTDSICSAIAYADLKNKAAGGYFPARLGELNRETRFVLEHFDVEEPDFLPHVYVRAQDLMQTDVISAPIDCSIFDVGELLRKHSIHALPVLDEQRRARGVITESSLARSYVQELQVRGLQHRPTRLGRIAETLGARLVLGDPETELRGNILIGAMSPGSMAGYISQGDLLILGDREDAQTVALQCDISCLIITGDFVPSPQVQQQARARGAAIIVTAQDTFATARLINLSVPALDMLDPDVLTVTPDTLIREIEPALVESRAAIALVSDEDGRVIGVLTKSDLVTRRRRRVILVDHSERSLSVAGVEQAEILEIVDHHRLGGLETMDPLMATIAPVGCTATLVLRRYHELGLEPPQEIAGLMAAAILSDTMLLKSPTTTPEDIAAVKHLGQLLDADPLAFGARMYDAKFDTAALSPEAIVANDLKISLLGSTKVGISQVEVGDAAKVMRRKAEILAALAELQARQAFDLMVLMITDIVHEGTELLAMGDTRLVEKAFGVSLQNHGVYLPGVLSRKKQVVPVISRAL